nr:hypothetical protein [Thermoflexibacter sp.]
EEALYSYFAELIFDKVLGYNRVKHGEKNLMLQKKSEIDGTKCDFALGYFTKNKEVVIAVVEIKDAHHTNLDKPQNRKNEKNTPTEQAFLYAIKHDDCKWIIVSNFKEIRLYSYKHKSIRYETFYLSEEIKKDNELKRFLFLLHKNNLMNKSGISKIEKLYEEQLNNEGMKYEPKNSKGLLIESHKNHKNIIDEIEYCIQKFNGFGFIPTNILSNCKPFNTNPTSRIWNYQVFSLITNNQEVYEFFKNTIIKDKDIDLSSEYKTFIKEDFTHYKDKVQFIIQQLNHFLIHRISFEGKESVNIKINNHETCDCLQCNYESLDFGKIVKKLKNFQGNPPNNSLENAYALYKVPIDRYKPAYQMYKAIQKSSKEQSKDIDYFIATYNLSKLGNIMWSDYNFEDRETVIQELEEIDLQKEIHDALDITIDIDVREALLELAESKFFDKIEWKVDEILDSIKKIKKLYDNRGSQIGGENAYSLWQQQFYLYLYTRQNFVIFDKFTNYQKIQRKILEGFILSYKTSNEYTNKLKKFNYFILINNILYLSSDDLKILFDENNIEALEIDEETYPKLLTNAHNILGSLISINQFSNLPNQDVINLLNNSAFEYAFGRILNNLFFVLSKINIQNNDFQAIEKILPDFIKFHDKVAWFHLKGVSEFIYKKGHLFKFTTLYDILKILVDRHNPYTNQYVELMEKICISIAKNFPENKISDNRFLHKLLGNFIEERQESGHRDLLPFWQILSIENQQKLLDEFISYLDKKFNSDFYYELFRRNIIDYNYKDYFEKYKNRVINELTYYTSGKSNNDSFGVRDYSYSFILLCQIIYMKNLFGEKIFEQVADLRNFEIWLINPYDFDYSKFEIEWIERVAWYTFTDVLKNIPPLKERLYSYLKDNPSDSKISKIYFEHFA